MPHFPLVTVGTVVRALELGRPDWPPGSVIYTGPEKPTSRVARVLETEEDDPGDALQGAPRRTDLRTVPAWP
jgi:hypothetical protein